MKRLDYFVISRPGGEKEENDDFAIVNPDLGVLVVADGMGGRAGGSQASRAATQAFVEEMQSVPIQSRLAVSNLQAAVTRANRCVRSLVETDPSLSGLGTTLSAIVLNGVKGKTVHVGDSRIYVFGENGLAQLTRDHTLVAELVERQHLSPEGAKRYPLRNVLSRCIGPQESVEADIQDIDLRVGDWLLLTTDGLTKALAPENLRDAIAGSAADSAEALCREIVEAAEFNPPNDDITAIVARILEGNEIG